MAKIEDCVGKCVKISKHSITIKDESGKTRGVVRDISSIYDMQANKKMDYYSLLTKNGLRDVNIKEVIVKDCKMYIFRNMHSMLFHDKYGYFSDYEREREEKRDALYQKAVDSGITVIHCMFV